MAAAARPRPTRGDGLLEGLFAKWRADAALKPIKPPSSASGILDIGCGPHPRFLMRAPFRRKVGLDQILPVDAAPDIEIVRMNLGTSPRLPFADASFACVASLACIEHLDPGGLPGLMAEIFRVLEPGGQAVLTTPHALADGLLRALARVGIVSHEEIAEHRNRFRRGDVRALLAGAGFAAEKVRVEGFLLGLNILAVAEK
jgi:SAM-dependent methyltransferase